MSILKKTIASFLLSAFCIVFLSNCKKSDNNSKPIYPTDCGHLLVGSYTGSDYCSGTGAASYPCSITAIDSNNITFSNLGGATVTARLDCSNNTINIPTQTFPNGFSISGTGNYTANRIIVTWSGLSLGTLINCSTTFTR